MRSYDHKLTALSLCLLTPACGAPLVPEETVSPDTSSYKADTSYIESRTLNVQTNSKISLNPITTITPLLARMDAGEIPSCYIAAATSDPLPWANETDTVWTQKGMRFFKQSGDQFYFFSVNSVVPNRLFSSTPASCNLTASRIVSSPNDTDNFATSRIVIPTTTFDGILKNGVLTKLFNDELAVWTMRDTESLFDCMVAIRFNTQNPKFSDYTNYRNVSNTSPSFFLQRDTEKGHVIYKFDLEKRPDRKNGIIWGTNPAGNCDAKITRYVLKTDTVNATNASGPSASVMEANDSKLASDVLRNNIKISFSSTTRIEAREQDVQQEVQTGTRYRIERTVTSTNEITFGDTSSTGVDFSTPLVELLTGGLIRAEIKNNWENRFSRGVGESTSITASVELDPKFCKKWLYSVFATVRDGTIDASSYGEKRPIPFSIVENLRIDAKPMCPTK